MRSWEWNGWYNLSFCDAQHMFQPLIEFVSLNPEFAMLTTGPPYFSLQSSEMSILPYAISIFLLNRIIIKFGNKARRRREKHSTMSRVFPYTSFALLLLPACFTTEHIQGFFICIRQLYLYVNSRKRRPSGYVFVFFLDYRLCVCGSLLRRQMGWPRPRKRKFWLKIRNSLFQ